MSVHSRIDKTLDELLDMPSVINYLGRNITFPKLAVAQARISGRAEGLAEGLEQGSLEMAGLVRERLIPNLEERANESLTQLGEKFITSFANSNIRGVLVRDELTGLPIKVHPSMTEMFSGVRGKPYYYPRDLIKKKGDVAERLKNPEQEWSREAGIANSPDMSNPRWLMEGRRFPRYYTGELKSTRNENLLLSKLDNFPRNMILRDMRSKKSFHVHDWNIPNREVVTNLRALPAPDPARP